MPTGVVKVRKDNGFGFIAPDEGGKDVFFHVKDLARGTDESQMVAGARVGFEVRHGDRGLMACQVGILTAEPAANSQSAPRAISVDEAVRGLKDALLASLEWVDALEEARKAEA